MWRRASSPLEVLDASSAHLVICSHFSYAKATPLHPPLPSFSLLSPARPGRAHLGPLIRVVARRVSPGEDVAETAQEPVRLQRPRHLPTQKQARARRRARTHLLTRADTTKRRWAPSPPSLSRSRRLRRPAVSAPRRLPTVAEREREQARRPGARTARTARKARLLRARKGRVKGALCVKDAGAT